MGPDGIRNEAEKALEDLAEMESGLENTKALIAVELRLNVDAKWVISAPRYESKICFTASVFSVDNRYLVIVGLDKALDYVHCRILDIRTVCFMPFKSVRIISL